MFQLSEIIYGIVVFGIIAFLIAFFIGNIRRAL